MKRGNVYDLAIFDGDEASGLLADLADMPTLKIAAEYNMRVLMENRRLMDVRQRPIIVAFVNELIERAGRIVGVTSHAAESGVNTPILKTPLIGAG